jgi:ABC-type multidrug transport system permease subunit
MGSMSRGFLTELWDGVSLKRSTGPYSGLKWDIIGMFLFTIPHILLNLMASIVAIGFVVFVYTLPLTFTTLVIWACFHTGHAWLGWGIIGLVAVIVMTCIVALITDRR